MSTHSIHGNPEHLSVHCIRRLIRLVVDNATSAYYEGSEDVQDTHISVLKHPKAGPVVVDLVPEAQPDENAPRDVSYCPEVEGEKHDDQDRL